MQYKLPTAKDEKMNWFYLVKIKADGLSQELFWIGILITKKDFNKARALVNLIYQVIG